MRLLIIAAVIFAIAIVAVLLMLKKPSHPDGAALYTGTGETNMDLSSPENVLYMDLDAGRVIIQMRPDLAP